MRDGILISGVSGLIGSSVVRALKAKSIHAIKLVRRSAEAGERALLWNPGPGKVELPVLGSISLDAAVHLSGANVSARRWTEAYKREIIGSRVDSTRAVCRLIAGAEHRPRVLLSASAVGIYGDRGDELIDEGAQAGMGFLADTCRAWEAATEQAGSAGIRVVHLRFGVVLAPEGGALGTLLPLFRTGLGARLGGGCQWMSWITVDDAVAAMLYAIDDESLSGAVNVTAPAPVTNAEFTRTLGRVLRRPAVLTVPAFALRLAAGEMADEALLAGCRAVPAKLMSSRFVFGDPSLEPALRRLLKVAG